MVLVRLMIRVLAIAICLAATGSRAMAQSNPQDIDISYLVDGGALEFIWLPNIAILAMYKVGPPSEPRLFPSDEGGEPKKDDTVPSYYTAIATGTTMLGLLAYPSDGRWYHFKGFIQASSMANLTTGAFKNLFGRQRPSFDLDAPTDEDRKSFPSGHATSALRITTYAALYLRYHVFEDARGDAVMTWQEGVAYSTLAALAVYAPYTRVDDNRHHISDVIAGSAIGFSYSMLFFYYQESRLNRHTSNTDKVALSPWDSGRGLSVGWTY
jgi:membrane-associated phospholipid phosphatase